MNHRDDKPSFDVFDKLYYWLMYPQTSIKKLASLIARNAWKYLFVIGVLNIVRGFLNTALVEWTAMTILRLDLAVLREVRLVTLTTYGWINWVEGLIYILVALRVRHVVPHILALAFLFPIPVGVISANLFRGSSASWGNAPYVHLIYLLVTAVPILAVLVDSRLVTTAPKRLFDEVAPEYEAARPGYPQELVEDIIRIAEIPRGGRILEVGCGTGKATTAFAAHGYAMLCLDIGPQLIAVAQAKCQKYPDVTFQCVGFEEWEPERNAFDLLISATAFHWVRPEVRYAKAAEVLKDTGYLAVFWNRQPAASTDFMRAVQRLYRRIVPEMKASEERDVERSIREREDEIKTSGYFEDVEVNRYPWSRVLTADQYLTLLESTASHRRIADYRRARLYAAIRKLIDEQYGGRVVKPYLAVLYIAKKKAM